MPALYCALSRGSCCSPGCRFWSPAATEATTRLTRSGIEALAARGARTAVIAHEDTSFASAVAKGAARHLAANGIEVLAVETHPEDIQDVSAIMTKFRDLDPAAGAVRGHLLRDGSEGGNARERLQSHTSSRFRP